MAPPSQELEPPTNPVRFSLSSPTAVTCLYSLTDTILYRCDQGSPKVVAVCDRRRIRNRNRRWVSPSTPWRSMTPDELARGPPCRLRQSPSSANRNLFRLASNARSVGSSRYMTATPGFWRSVKLGPDVVPALRRLLFAPEASGLYQTRHRATEALAALGAFDVLADFLRSRRPIADPVERVGEEVVIGAAARAIARLREEWVYRF